MLLYLEDRMQTKKNSALKLEDSVLKFYLLYIESLLKLLIICISDSLFIQQDHSVQVMELWNSLSYYAMDLWCGTIVYILSLMF